MAKTDQIQQSGGSIASLDRFDRKILGALVADATQSYADLGRLVGLSAPAVHERVKKLKQAGVVTGIHARLDGRQIGRPLLVFVHVSTHNWGHSDAIDALAVLPELEEMHSVTGDTSVILKVRMANTEALESLLRQINAFESVVATHTFVTLSTYLDRPVQPGETEVWPATPRPSS